MLRGLVRHAGPETFAVDVLFLRPGPVVESIRRARRGRVLATDVGRLRSPRSVGRGVRTVSRALRATRPDVVVAMEPSAYVYVALPAARRQIPVVWQQHGGVDPGWGIDRLVRALPARMAIANSDFVAARLRALTRVPVEVVRPGIDVERFAGASGDAVRRRIGARQRDVLVGIVGRLQPWKGQHLFLRAAANVLRRFPETRFVVVGGAEMGWETGDYPGELRALARQLEITDSVTFSGHVDDTSPWTAACDVVVSASAAEPFGLAICEAQAAGCAVIAIAEGGPLEIIDDGVDGVLTTRDVDALTRSIGDLVAAPERRRSLGTAAATTARTNHDARRMANDVSRLLRGTAA